MSVWRGGGLPRRNVEAAFGRNAAYFLSNFERHNQVQILPPKAHVQRSCPGLIAIYLDCESGLLNRKPLAGKYGNAWQPMMHADAKRDYFKQSLEP